MRRWLTDNGLLVDQPTSKPFVLEVYEERDDHVVEGLLRSDQGNWFSIELGVPCFTTDQRVEEITEFARRHNLPAPATVGDESSDRQQTIETFSDKWRRFRRFGMEPAHREHLMAWYCQKLGVATIEELKDFYAGKELILEAGPGSGVFNSRFMAESTSGQVVAADISDAAYTTFDNTRDLQNCHVIRADLMQLPLPDAFFDFIIADGVLHHTPNTQQALGALYQKLKPGGQMFFYVYRRMGPAREFCDRYLREQFTRLSPEECYRACEGLTELGRALAGLGAQVHLDRPLPLLGIPAGTHDVQRLVYYNFIKCFWNDAYDFETNNMINYDWYHPRFAWQHTEDEVRAWLTDLGVETFRFNEANPNGLSVLLTKPD